MSKSICSVKHLQCVTGYRAYSFPSTIYYLVCHTQLFKLYKVCENVFINLFVFIFLTFDICFMDF